MRTLCLAMLMTMVSTSLGAQMAKPAGLRASVPAKSSRDSVVATPSAAPTPPKIVMPAPAKPVLTPSPATNGPTARERAGLAKATRAMKQTPRGTPATSGRVKPPLLD